MFTSIAVTGSALLNTFTLRNSESGKKARVSSQIKVLEVLYFYFGLRCMYVF